MTNHVLKRYEVILDEKAQKVLVAMADRYGTTVADFLIKIVEDRLADEAMGEELIAHHRNYGHTISELKKLVSKEREMIANNIKALGESQRRIEEAESNKQMMEFKLREATGKTKARGRKKLGL